MPMERPIRLIAVSQLQSLRDKGCDVDGIEELQDANAHCPQAVLLGRDDANDDEHCGELDD